MIGADDGAGKAAGRCRLVGDEADWNNLRGSEADGLLVVVGETVVWSVDGPTPAPDESNNKVASHIVTAGIAQSRVGAHAPNAELSDSRPKQPTT